MRRGMGVVIALMLVVSVAAMAGDKAPLSDRQLSSITAGSDFGASGAVVANGSSATIAKTGSVALEGSVQTDVNTLNLFNSSASAIGSGMNVWEGNLTTDADAFKAVQSNFISASFGSGAHLNGYFRDPSVALNDASVTVDYANTNLGLNLAYAGQERKLDVAYASDKTFGLNTASAFSHDASQSVSASQRTAFGLDAFARYANTNSTTASAAQNTTADLTAGFNYVNMNSLGMAGMQSSGSSSASNYQNAGDPSASGAADASSFDKSGFGLAANQFTQAGAGLDASYSDTRDFGFNHTDATAAAGALAVGYLNSRTFDANATESTAANQSLDVNTADSKRFNLSASDEFKTLLANLQYAKTTFGLDLSIGSLVWSGAMELADADAEYVVVDNSQLDVTENYSIALSGSAQNNISAANVVNAAGSIIGLGTNVARTPADSDSLHFSQINTIVLK